MPSSKDFESVAKFNGNAGPTFDIYEEALLNAAAGRTDDRGWSLADHLLAPQCCFCFLLLGADDLC